MEIYERAKTNSISSSTNECTSVIITQFNVRYNIKVET